MTLNITFIPASKDTELLVPIPKPAKNFIPDWYKQIPHPTKDLTFRSAGDVGSQTIKSCVPFLDAYTNGYIQETWTDIYISTDKNNETIIDYNWAMNPKILEHRKNNSGFNKSQNFYDLEFVWFEQWIPKMPKGYSALYTSPLNHFDLPFRSLDAIIDSDNYYHEYSGKYPFLINKGFTGIIPAGTPMYQIIPIKRDEWSSTSEKFNEDLNKKRQHYLRKHFINGYKSLFWEKKGFN